MLFSRAISARYLTSSSLTLNEAGCSHRECLDRDRRSKYCFPSVLFIVSSRIRYIKWRNFYFPRANSDLSGPAPWDKLFLFWVIRFSLLQFVQGCRLQQCRSSPFFTNISLLIRKVKMIKLTFELSNKLKYPLSSSCCRSFWVLKWRRVNLMALNVYNLWLKWSTPL